MADEPLYETIGRTYSTTRREDPRIRDQIHAALGEGRTVVNVGAGTGSYEPPDREVVAVEPSPAMIAQRTGRTPRVVQGIADHLPFTTGAFDIGMAVLTMHHWGDAEIGLRELGRVSRRQVIFFFETIASHDFWVMDYFPESRELTSEQAAPGVAEIERTLQLREVRPVLVPADCQDGFGFAFWSRPDAYADPAVQAGMSWLAQLPPDVLARGSDRLRADLASGEWDRRHGHLREQDWFDGGYRLAIAGD